MKRKMTSVIAICTGLGLAGPAMADCQAELAELTGGTGMDSGGGIAKDGSMAPLEGADSSGSDTMTESGSVIIPYLTAFLIVRSSCFEMWKIQIV